MKSVVAFCLVFALYGVNGIPVKTGWSNGTFLGMEPEVPELHIPTADGLFHFYVLPVGQGDAHIIQCPNGDLSVLDMGSSDSASAKFWATNEIVNYLSGHFNRIRNVIITHNHVDHYSLLPTVLSSARDLSGLTNVYITCVHADLPANIQTWLTSISATNKVRTFNGGQPCGPLRPVCGSLNLCPSNSNIVTKVMAANLENCVGSNKNIDSVVFKVTHNQVSIMFNGDFEDATSSQTANGHQKAMIDYYGAELRVTAYKLSHHGAQTLANKINTCHAHAPKAIFMSGNSFYMSYRHPRCDVVDTFRNDVRTLCRPLDTNSASAYYCANHPESVSADNKLQRTYTCGPTSSGTLTTTNNDLAIYTTTPDANTMNLIKFSSDGTRWGFTNSFQTLKKGEEEMDKLDEEDLPAGDGC